MRGGGGWGGGHESSGVCYKLSRPLHDLHEDMKSERSCSMNGRCFYILLGPDCWIHLMIGHIFTRIAKHHEESKTWASRSIRPCSRLASTSLVHKSGSDPLIQTGSSSEAPTKHLPETTVWTVTSSAGSASFFLLNIAMHRKSERPRPASECTLAAKSFWTKKNK